MKNPGKLVTRVVVLALVAITGFALMRGSGDTGRTILQVDMPDAGQLEIGASVRGAGALIGTIKDIALDSNRHAVLTLSLQQGVLVEREDARVTVRPSNLLGEDYVDLNPGSDSAPFMTRDFVPANQTVSATTIQDVLDTLDAPRGAQLAAVITTLGEGLDGNGSNTAKALAALAPALTDTNSVAKLLAAQNTLLSRLVDTTDPVASALADNGGKTLNSLVSSTEELLAGVRGQQAALASTLEQLPATLTSAQQTLARFGGTAAAAQVTLHGIRPLTGNLSAVVGELENFANAADPALASLKPVLAEADRLLQQAAPVVAELRRSGPNLTTAAKSLNPLSRELLDRNLGGVMDFVRKWALSTNGSDSLSHYFRGVIYLTPKSLESIAQSLIPPGLGIQLPTSAGLTTTGGGLGGTLSGLNNLLGGSLSGLLGNPAQSKKSTTKSDDSGSGALGLTSTQEQSLVQQLLGGLG
jgi:phospholipid/cholesterol/gamma-HCH transport system substrate-binding protein